MKLISHTYLDITLKGRSWLLDNPKGHVVIFEGMEEHAKRYVSFAEFLNKNGYSVSCLDYFGQGDNVSSDLSNRGLWPKYGFFTYIDFVNDYIKSIKEPVYIFSHSMGSFFSQYYIQKYSENIKGLVMCGAGGKNPATGLGFFLSSLVCIGKNKDENAKFLSKLMFGGFNKKIKNPKTTYDWLSCNEDNVKKYMEDPLSGFGSRNSFCHEFLRFMNKCYLKKDLKNISKDLPIFIIAGKEDPVANYGKYSKELTDMYLKLGIKNVSYKLYSKLRHEILNETDPTEVLEDILSFLK